MTRVFLAGRLLLLLFPAMLARAVAAAPPLSLPPPLPPGGAPAGVSAAAAAAVSVPAEVSVPSELSRPVVKAHLNLEFERARQALLGKTEALRAMRDLGNFDEAARRAGELVTAWQKQTNEWRDRALATIDKVAGGEAKPADADRAVDLYALGEAETQHQVQLLGETLQQAGKAAEQDQIMLERLRGLNEKARAQSLAETLRPTIKETENRILAIASGHVQHQEADAAFALLTRLYSTTSNETRRAVVMEKMLGLYTDLITSKRFRVAARIVGWYIANGDVRVHSWREETMRLVRLLLFPDPVCGPRALGGKNGEMSAPDVIDILCRFFINTGTADALTWKLMGRAHQLAGELGQAIDWYKWACADRPHDAETYAWMAECYANLGDLGSASRTVMRAVNSGWPVKRILEDTELEPMYDSECYRYLKQGSLF